MVLGVAHDTNQLRAHVGGRVRRACWAVRPRSPVVDDGVVLVAQVVVLLELVVGVAEGLLVQAPLRRMSTPHMASLANSSDCDRWPARPC